MKARSQSNQEPEPTPQNQHEGLFVRGVVQKRWRRILDSGVEVVNYLISGISIQRYNPNNNYFALGQYVEIPVRVSVYVTKQGPRYSLTEDDGHVEGEF